MSLSRSLKRIFGAIGAGIAAALPEQRHEGPAPTVQAGKSEQDIAQAKFRRSPERAALVSDWRAMVAAELASRPVPHRDLATYVERTADDWKPPPTEKPTDEEWDQAFKYPGGKTKPGASSSS